MIPVWIACAAWMFAPWFVWQKELQAPEALEAPAKAKHIDR